MTLTELLTGGSTGMATVIWPLLIGVYAAIAIAYANKRTIGKLVKRLLEKKAEDEETALTVEELGFKPGQFRYALRDNSLLRKIIRQTEDEAGTKRYYLPKESSYRAETVYKPDGTSVLTLILAAAALVAIGLFLLHVTPELIQMLENTIEKIKESQ